MNRNFIILSSGRSGSSMLRQLVSCHPSIFCHAELLNRCDLLHYNLIRDGRTVVSSHYLIKYIKARLVSWKPWLPYTGFKLFNEHIEFCKLSLGNLLNALRNPPVIVLPYSGKFLRAQIFANHQQTRQKKKFRDF